LTQYFGVTYQWTVDGSILNQFINCYAATQIRNNILTTNLFV